MHGAQSRGQNSLSRIPWRILEKTDGDSKETIDNFRLFLLFFFFLIKNYTERYPTIRLLLAWIHTRVLPRFTAGHHHGEKKDRGLQLRSLLTSHDNKRARHRTRRLGTAAPHSSFSWCNLGCISSRTI